MATGNPFWTFSLAIYAIEGVAPACLRLQDRHGLDVNLLLYCCWAGRCGVALDAPAVARMLELTADWTTRVVQPLRAARRALKGAFETMPAAACLSLRDAVAKLELDAERIEQDALAAALPPAAPTRSGHRAIAEANLEIYLAARNVVADSATAGDIARLIDAAWPA